MPGGGVQEVLPRSSASVSRMGVLCRGRRRSQQKEKRQREKQVHFFVFFAFQKWGNLGEEEDGGVEGVTLIVTPDFAASRFFLFKAPSSDGFSCFLFFLRLAPISLTRILKTPLSFLFLFFTFAGLYGKVHFVKCGPHSLSFLSPPLEGETGTVHAREGGEGALR